MNQAEQLSQLCTEERLRFRSEYTSVYRAWFSLNGKEQYWDIFRMSEQQDADESRIRTLKYPGAEEESSEERRERIFRHCDNLRRIQESTLDALKVNSIDAAAGPVEWEEASGKQTFYVTQPLLTLEEAGYLSHDGTDLQHLMMLSVRLLMMIRTFREAGLAAGFFDPAELFVLREGEKDIIKNGCFRYTGPEGETMRFPGRETEGFVFHQVRDGSLPQSADSDIYVLVSLLWTMLCGNHWSVPPDRNQSFILEDPRLRQVLENAWENGYASFKELNTCFREIMKSINTGNRENVRIAFQRPAYTEASAKKEEPSSCGKAKKRRLPSERKNKGVLLLTIAALVLLILSQSVGLFRSEQEIMVEETPEPTVELPVATSDELRMYSYEGQVVDYYGRYLYGYTIDGNGNLLSADQGTMLIAAGNLKEYVYPELRCTLNGEKSIELLPEALPYETTVWVEVLPANATCREVEVSSADYACTLLGLGSDAESMTMNESAGEEGLLVRILCSRFGHFTVDVSCMAGHRSETVTIHVTEKVIPTPAAVYYGNGGSGGGYVPQPTPIPTPVPTADPYANETFGLSAGSVTLSVGQSTTVYPSHSASFLTSDPNVASVNGAGVITAHGAGTCSITAICNEEGSLYHKQAVVTVQVN